MDADGDSLAMNLPRDIMEEESTMPIVTNPGPPATWQPLEL